MSVVPSAGGELPTANDLESVYRAVFKYSPFTCDSVPSFQEATIGEGRLSWIGFSHGQGGQGRLEAVAPESMESEVEDTLRNFLSACEPGDCVLARQEKIRNAHAVLDFHGKLQSQTETRQPGDPDANPDSPPSHQAFADWPILHRRAVSFEHRLPHTMSVVDRMHRSSSSGGADLLDQSRVITWTSEREGWSVIFTSSCTTTQEENSVDPRPSTVVMWTVDIVTDREPGTDSDSNPESDSLPDSQCGFQPHSHSDFQSDSPPDSPSD